MIEMRGFQYLCWGVSMAFVGVFAGCHGEVTNNSTGGAAGAGGASVGSSSSGAIACMGAAGTGGGGMGGSGGEVMVLAMNEMFFEDPDPDGWKQYGFDLDDRISTSTSTDLCAPVAGGTAVDVYPDGNHGIDNAFGNKIVPLFRGLGFDLPFRQRAAISGGKFTYLLALPDLGQGPPSTSSPFYLARDFCGTPLFDGMGVWPVDPSSLFNPADPKSTKWFFTITNLGGGIVETNQLAQFDLVLDLNVFQIVLPIRQARLRFQLDAGQQNATMGQLGGIIATEDLVREIAKLLATGDSSFYCNPKGLENAINSVRRASDILLDGSQDPFKECDGISIGIGFTMKADKLGGVAPPVSPPPDPCGENCVRCGDYITHSAMGTLCASSQGLYNTYHQCMCSGACEIECSNNFCNGNPASALCKQCAEHANGCMNELAACANDL